MLTGVDGTELRVPGAAKERAVLAILALRAGKAVAVTELIYGLWGETPPRSAVKTLQAYVSALRRNFLSERIETVAGGYRLAIEPESVDVVVFEHILREASDALAGGDPRVAVTRVGQALQMWRGEPLGDLADHPAGTAEIARLVELRRGGEELSADARLAMGEHNAVIGDLEAAVAAEPLRERRWAQLMVALYRAGRQADALRAYQRLRGALADELGLEPSGETRSLEAAILAQDPALELRPQLAAISTSVGKGLPSGNVTFLFTDLEGSTRLFRQLRDRYPALLEQHRRIIRAAVDRRGGVEVSTEGDGMFVAFADAVAAVESCVDAQVSLSGHPWPDDGGVRVRMGLHTGIATPTPEHDYTSVAVHQTARIASAAHGGQVLLSEETVNLIKDVLPDEISLLDCGRFRLDGFDEPDRLYQLCHPRLERSFPRPRAAPASTHNLPPELTSFVPRPAQLADVTRRLEAPGLVTLTGAGGTGKTRLALRAARDAEDRFDGVWLCELAPLQDAARVTGELASTLRCEAPPGADLLAAVSQRLADGVQLLILDNCEHLLDATADLVVRLRRAAPDLHLLATSRSPMGIDGEIVYRVPSLSVPKATTTPSELVDFEAVRLFVERAEAQWPGFALDERNGSAVAQICASLDGIPLAIELAAARLRVMSVEDVASRLHDRFRLLAGGTRTAPPRQRTLAALIDWSYDLMADRERRALSRLAVLPAGFDLATAEAVVDDEGWGDVVEVVSSLVDKSLLQFDASAGITRYRMLETVREYAVGKLDDNDQAAAQAAAATHFLELTEAAATELIESDRLAWLTRLEPDDENLRAAFITLLAGPDPTPALRFGAAISKFWNTRGLYGDEMALLEASLDRPDASGATLARGEALAAAGYLQFRSGEYTKAQRRLTEALAIATECDSAERRAGVLRTMAWVADRRGEHESATSLAQAALQAALDGRDDHQIARAYDVRAAMSQHHDPVAARRDYAESLRYCYAAGDQVGQATTLNNLAVLELEQGDHSAARNHFVEALRIAEDIHDSALIPFLEYGVGLTAVLAEDFEAAEPALVRAFAAAKQTGQRSLVAYTLLGIAIVRTAADRPSEAAALLGASSALFEDVGEHPERIEAGLREATAASLRKALGDGFEPALIAGRRAKPSAVVRMATSRL
jgi:predicted ATPase/class 3 adenylate cyclase